MLRSASVITILSFVYLSWLPAWSAFTLLALLAITGPVRRPRGSTHLEPSASDSESQEMAKRHRTFTDYRQGGQLPAALDMREQLLAVSRTSARTDSISGRYAGSGTDTFRGTHTTDADPGDCCV